MCCAVLAAQPLGGRHARAGGPPAHSAGAARARARRPDRAVGHRPRHAWPVLIGGCLTQQSLLPGGVLGVASVPRDVVESRRGRPESGEAVATQLWRGAMDVDSRALRFRAFFGCVCPFVRHDSQYRSGAGLREGAARTFVLGAHTDAACGH